MPLITWGPELLVNVRQSDAQHRKLVECINELHDAMKQGAGQEKMLQVLEALDSYTRFHFTDEEELLASHGYPLTNHRALHGAFIEKLNEFKQDFRQGKLISLEVMHFLKDWLLQHIQGDDRKYGIFLNNKGIV